MPKTPTIPVSFEISTRRITNLLDMVSDGTLRDRVRHAVRRIAIEFGLKESEAFDTFAKLAVRFQEEGYESSECCLSFTCNFVMESKIWRGRIREVMAA